MPVRLGPGRADELESERLDDPSLPRTNEQKTKEIIAKVTT